MEIFTAWLILASVNLVATMSPGPAFALTVRNSMIYSRRACLLCCLGLGLGVAIHVTLVLAGFAVLITKSSLLYNAVRYAGAAYLLYVGVKSLTAQKRDLKNNDNEPAPHKTISGFAALRMGTLTNLLNPKSMVFFTAVYAQFITPGIPWTILVLYGITTVLIEILWFMGMSVILTDPRVKRRFLGLVHWIERVCGGLLILLGIRLALSKGLS